jgi:putative colanic acid biosysnthesis UDP-glucose lipid carrier transferase
MEDKITSTNRFHEYADLPITETVTVSVEGLFYTPGYTDRLVNFINIKTNTSLSYPPLDISFNRIIKRSFDIFFSISMIIGVLSWLIPIMAVLIWFDSKGPVFFLQKRNKRNGELFTCIKFRSMIVNAAADILPAGRNDKRITPIGQFLRNHYIDELPQFLNVLLGDMSVIGPRPHMINDNIKYGEQIDNYERRHKGKPGITGLAQVLGYVGVAENIQEMKDRVGLDIFYLQHWSFRFDMVILYKTFRKIIGLPLQ